MVAKAASNTEEDILQLKSAMWATGHLGTSEMGVRLLESSLVVDGMVRIASHSPVLALRGTAFFALNLVATTFAGVELLSRFGKARLQLQVINWAY